MIARLAALPGLALFAFATQTVPAWRIDPPESVPPPLWPSEGLSIEEPPPAPRPRISIGEISGSLQRRRWRRVRRAPLPAPALPDEALGALSVRAAIRAIGPVVHRCYDTALRLDPELRGAPVFRLRVARGGRVEAVAIERDVEGAPSLTDCFTRALSAVRLPAGASGLDVEVPFLLEPEEPGRAAVGALAEE